MIFTPKLIGIVAAGSLVLAATSYIYGYRAGSRSVEAEYDQLRQEQRMAALSASEAYQDYLKRFNANEIRKRANNEAKTNPNTCVVANGNWLQLYEAAGLRDATR